MDWETLEVIPVTEKAYQCSCRWKLDTHPCAAEAPFYSSVKRCCASLILKQIQNLFLSEKKLYKKSQAIHPA